MPPIFPDPNHHQDSSIVSSFRGAIRSLTRLAGVAQSGEGDEYGYGEKAQEVSWHARLRCVFDR